MRRSLPLAPFSFFLAISLSLVNRSGILKLVRYRGLNTNLLWIRCYLSDSLSRSYAQKLPQASFLMPLQDAGLGKHAFHHRPRFRPLAPKAGLHKNVSDRAVGAVRRNYGRYYRRQVIRSLHVHPSAATPDETFAKAPSDRRRR
jgi:hypothetical protein